MKEKSKAKEIIEARFHPSNLQSTTRQCVLEKGFPDAGDLVVFKVVYTDELAAECTLLEYNEQRVFLLRGDEDPQDILAPGDARVAFVLRANKTNGKLLISASANQISF
jgi:translation initiation factor 2 alpha subunit (eIF-2alpha)